MIAKLKYAGILLILALMISTNVAFADTGTVTFTGGALTLDSQNGVDFGGVVLNGTEQTLTQKVAAWSVKDGRGAFSGWHVTVSATPFTSPEHALPESNFKMRLLNREICILNGIEDGRLINPMPDYVPLTLSPRTLLSYPAIDVSDTFSYLTWVQFNPEYTLTVPGNAFAGNYTSTITATVVAGP